MKKGLLGVTSLLLLTLTLAGCNFSCNKTVNENENNALDQATQNCLDKGGTHSLIHSQTAVYGECSFPSGVTCEDQALVSGECDFEPNTESIDTEEKRLAGCEENVQGWLTDFMSDAEDTNIEWGDEEEGGASFVRNGIIKYTKDGSNWKISAECVADFVDGSISISYGDPETDDE